MKCMLFLFTSLISFSTLAMDQQHCQMQLGLKMAEEASRMNQNYTSIKNGSKIRSGNNSGLYLGANDTGILLVHGFTASPFEVVSLGKHLNQLGYTVYLPLIEGFGANSNVANNYGYLNWRESLARAVSDLKTCFKKIVLIGFSNGGGLVVDYFLKTQDPNIVGIVALSPYVKTVVPGARFLNAFMDIFTDNIDFKTAYTLTHNEDLVPMQVFPEHYTEGAPTKAVHSILDYSEVIQSQKLPIRSKIPVFLGYSEYDQTIDGNAAYEFLSANFENLDTRIFMKEEKVSHHLLLNVLNNKPQIVLENVAWFIWQITQ